MEQKISSVPYADSILEDALHILVAFSFLNLDCVFFFTSTVVRIFCYGLIQKQFLEPSFWANISSCRHNSRQRGTGINLSRSTKREEALVLGGIELLLPLALQGCKKKEAALCNGCIDRVKHSNQMD